jgi:glycosyltransferase involved in cell wall biosynthesis
LREAVWSQPVSRSREPLVAVVTPVYNGGKYLERAMQSVQAQTYGNLVHVVLDNASTDETAQIIEMFRGGRVPVQAFRNDTLLPQAENWNKAFSYVPADAVYAKLLCADDLMRPECVASFVALAEREPSVEVVLCDDVYMDRVRQANLPRTAEVHDGKAVAGRILDGLVFWLPYQHFMVRLRDEDRGEAFFGREGLLDPFVVLRSALRGDVGYVRTPLVYTRWHEDAISARWFRECSLKPIELWLKLWRAALASGRADNASFSFFVAQMTKFILHRTLSGDVSVASRLRSLVAEHGFRVSSWDYVRCGLLWPVYFARKLQWRRMHGPRCDEAAFLADAPQPEIKKAA